jgi:hypothetical protein
MQSRKHQRDHDSNQQVATAIRPQLPRDGSAGQIAWHLGDLPKGGYRSVFPMQEGPFQTKMSPTSGGGKKVY